MSATRPRGCANWDKRMMTSSSGVTASRHVLRPARPYWPAIAISSSGSSFKVSGSNAGRRLAGNGVTSRDRRGVARGALAQAAYQCVHDDVASRVIPHRQPASTTRYKQLLPRPVSLPGDRGDLAERHRSADARHGRGLYPQRHGPVAYPQNAQRSVKAAAPQPPVCLGVARQYQQILQAMTSDAARQAACAPTGSKVTSSGWRAVLGCPAGTRCGSRSAPKVCSHSSAGARCPSVASSARNDYRR